MFESIIRHPEKVTLFSDKADMRLDSTGDGIFTAAGVELRTIVNNEALDIQLYAPALPVSRIRLTWTIKVPKTARLLGDAFERAQGTLCWSMPVAERIIPWYFLINFEGHTAGYGVKTGPKAFCFWQLEGTRLSLWLDVRSGTVPVVLGERILDAATVVYIESRENQNAFALYKDFAKLMCPAPVLPDDVVYGGNNWYYTYGTCKSEDLVRDAKLIASLAEGIKNKPYMVQDDGWQEFAAVEGASGCPYNRGNERFPDMPGLAADLKAAGVRPGIWMRPLICHDRYADGKMRLSSRCWKSLDPSYPGTLEYVAEQIKRLCDWGYEMIKYDFVTYDFFSKYAAEMDFRLSPSVFGIYNPSMTSAEAIGNLYKAIYDAAENRAVLIACNAISHIAAGKAHIFRGGDDTSGFVWERTRKLGINTLAFRLAQHNAFYAMDADCVPFTENVPDAPNMDFLDLISRSSTPLFISVSPDYIRPEHEKAIHDAFVRLNQPNELEPLDWFDTLCPGEYLHNGNVVTYDWYQSQITAAELSLHDKYYGSPFHF